MWTRPSPAARCGLSGHPHPVQARIIETWPIKLQDQLPVVPLPLLAPDPAVPLDLSSALSAVYDEAAYELSVDYGQSPPPSLSAEDAAWVETLL